MVFLKRLVQTFASFAARGGDRFRDQLVLRGKVCIEPAVRKAGRTHKVGYANAVEAVLAKFPGRGADDALVRLSLLFRRNRHVLLQLGDGKILHS